MEKRITLKDIALKVGVSQNTVSVALRGGSGVSKELREQIVAIAGDLGYSSKRVCVKKSVLIGSTAENFGDTYFYSDLYRLLCAKIKARGGNTVTIDLDAFASPGEIDPVIYKNNICAIIFLGDSDRQIVARLTGMKLPVMCCSFFYPDIPADMVIEDNYAGVYLLMKHLYEHNYRRIGFIGSPNRYFSFFERYLYFKSACESYGLPLDPGLSIVDLPPDSPLSLADMMSRLAQLPQLPEAFLCADNRIAVLTVKALEELGFHIPRDIAVTGFDNNDLARLSTPSVTTVDTMIELQAEAVAKQLWRKINADPASRTSHSRICLPVRLVYGDSVDLEHKLSPA